MNAYERRQAAKRITPEMHNLPTLTPINAPACEPPLIYICGEGARRDVWLRKTPGEREEWTRRKKQREEERREAEVKRAQYAWQQKFDRDRQRNELKEEEQELRKQGHRDAKKIMDLERENIFLK